MKYMSIAILLLFITGCASNDFILAPTGKDKATIMFEQNGLSHITIYENAYNCSGKQLWLTSFEPIEVEANKKRAFTAYSHKDLLISSFVPKPNELYKLKFNITKEKCYMSLLRVENINGIIKEFPEPSVRIREYQTQFIDGFCKP